MDPDAAWQGTPGAAELAPGRWQAWAGERTVGRLVLRNGGSRPAQVVYVPAAWIDQVQVWHREQGGAWQSAMAGDLVPLSRWPFAGQSPAFVVTVRDKPVDLMVMLVNATDARAPVWIMSDPVFRENQIRQANLSGVIMGLGIMVIVVTVIGGIVLRRRANWLLAGVSVWLLVTVASLNGYMAVWFTPEWPVFNDSAKHFAGVFLASLVPALTAEALDQRYLRRAERRLKWLMPLGGLVYGMVQIWLLPAAWRPLGAFIWTNLALITSLVLCGLSAVRGGRYVRWIAAAVACFTLSILIVYTPIDLVAGLDLRSAVVGVLFFASMLLYYQALFSRERYGRDVLGRAAIAANRDPLTALLSQQGLQEAYDKALLQQGVGGTQTPVMLFTLPGLEHRGADHGFVLADRVVVRFAACLQEVLGDAWSIARLNKTHFACIGVGAGHSVDVQALATHVLTRCTRLSEPVLPVTDFDLRIACTQRRLGADGLKALLAELDAAALAIVPPKRIVRV